MVHFSYSRRSGHSTSDSSRVYTQNLASCLGTQQVFNKKLLGKCLSRPHDKAPKSSVSCCCCNKRPSLSLLHLQCNLLIRDLLAWASSRAALPLSESAVNKENQERDSTPHFLSILSQFQFRGWIMLISKGKCGHHSIYRGDVTFKKLSLKTAF